MITTTPKRHWLLTAFLIFKILAFSVALCIYALSADRGINPVPNTPNWVLPALFSSLLGIASVVALFRWIELGFYVLCTIAVFNFAINLHSGAPTVSASVGLLHGPAGRNAKSSHNSPLRTITSKVSPVLSLVRT